MMVKIMRWLLTAGLTVGGLYGVYEVTQQFQVGHWLWPLMVVFGLVAAVVSFWLAPRLMAWLLSAGRWAEGHLQKLSSQDIVAGSLGLIVGLIIANLLGASLSHLPIVGPYLLLVANLVFGYLGWSIITKKWDEIVLVLGGLPRPGGKDRGSRQGTGQDRSEAHYKILDTSVIIDGRILDICETGFLEGVLVVPDFVLEELRHIADSSDALKRNRGRRGLDVLNKVREQTKSEVRPWKTGRADPGLEVDTRLVMLAQQLHGCIVTNDFNLNKVAALQGIKVLNINELANAVKPVVLPGEEMMVQLIKDGKESGQGVGYLDDGTMIVVENGRRFIGQALVVMVTSVLQTAAGRMIFARPKSSGKKGNSSPGNTDTIDRGEYQQWLT